MLCSWHGKLKAPLCAQGERAIKEITKQGEGQDNPMKVSKAKPRGRMGMGPGPGFGPPMAMGRGGGFMGRPAGGFQVPTPPRRLTKQLALQVHGWLGLAYKLICPRTWACIA